MHQWGDKDLQGRDICLRVGDAAEYIGSWLRTWARMNIDWKEKFGTVRAYSSFGWYDLHDAIYPGYMYNRFGKVGRFINRFTSGMFSYLNKIVIPTQKYLYVWRYKKAVEKWPDLYVEILASADWDELFEDKIPGYKNSDYWKKI